MVSPVGNENEGLDPGLDRGRREQHGPSTGGLARRPSRRRSRGWRSYRCMRLYYAEKRRADAAEVVVVAVVVIVVAAFGNWLGRCWRVLIAASSRSDRHFYRCGCGCRW